MKRTLVALPTILALGLSVEGAWGQSESTTQQSTQPSGYAPKVKIGSATASKADSPTPSAGAENKSMKTSVGKGNVKAKTVQPSSFWTERMDINEDGKPEDTDMLYDAARGVLYAAYEGPFTCENSETANGNILEAVYTRGNEAGKPVGSGWYLVEVDKGECGVKKAADYGCKFDASQNPTECGVATLNTATGELDVVVASK